MRLARLQRRNLAPATSASEARWFAALYLFEIGCAGLALGWYKYHGRFASLSVEQSATVLVPLLFALGAAALLVRTYRAQDLVGRRRFAMTLTANVFSVVFMLGAGELMVRLLSAQTDVGPSFAGTLLLPKRWELQRARNAALLLSAPPSSAYFVPDTLLGWSIGPSRSGKNGLYLSSVEGIRSPRLGIRYAGATARTRIAAIGDSFTFGLEGSYDDTWEAALGRTLGADSLVLDFGVDGYGIDQALLRYERDVRPRHPTLTILGFIDHDLGRAESVYTFMTYANWGLPFSKPRFRVEGDSLRLMNEPVLNPERIIAARSVTDLPYLQYEPGFNPDDWRTHWFDRSALARYVTSRFPRWPTLTEDQRAADARNLNIALIHAVARRVAADGSRLLVVYFPTKGDFDGLDRSDDRRILDSLQAANISHVDLSPCVRAIGESRAFIPGHQHYSREANAAVAACLLPLIRASVR